MINSIKPGKVLVILLGRFGKSSDSKDAFKSRIRIRIQQSEGGGWEIYIIDEMRKFEFCKTEKIYELKHQLRIVIFFYSVVLGKD